MPMEFHAGAMDLFCTAVDGLRGVLEQARAAEAMELTPAARSHVEPMAAHQQGIWESLCASMRLYARTFLFLAARINGLPVKTTELPTALVHQMLSGLLYNVWHLQQRFAEGWDTYRSRRQRTLLEGRVLMLREVNGLFMQQLLRRELNRLHATTVARLTHVRLPDTLPHCVAPRLALLLPHLGDNQHLAAVFDAQTHVYDTVVSLEPADFAVWSLRELLALFPHTHERHLPLASDCAALMRIGFVSRTFVAVLSEHRRLDTGLARLLFADLLRLFNPHEVPGTLTNDPAHVRSALDLLLGFAQSQPEPSVTLERLLPFAAVLLHNGSQLRVRVRERASLTAYCLAALPTTGGTDNIHVQVLRRAISNDDAPWRYTARRLEWAGLTTQAERRTFLEAFERLAKPHYNDAPLNAPHEASWDLAPATSRALASLALADPATAARLLPFAEAFSWLPACTLQLHHHPRLAVHMPCDTVHVSNPRANNADLGGATKEVLRKLLGSRCVTGGDRPVTHTLALLDTLLRTVEQLVRVPEDGQQRLSFAQHFENATRDAELRRLHPFAWLPDPEQHVRLFFHDSSVVAPVSLRDSVVVSDFTELVAAWPHHARGLHLNADDIVESGNGGFESESELVNNPPLRLYPCVRWASYVNGQLATLGQEACGACGGCVAAQAQ